MSNNTLVFINQEEGKVLKSGLVAIAAAKEIHAKHGGGELIGLLLGSGSANAAKELDGYGLSQLFVSENARYEKYQAVPYADAFEKVFVDSGAQIGVAAATTTGKDFMPRVAAKCDIGQASDIIGLNDDKSFKRPMYAGDVIADVEVVSERKLITARVSAFSPAEKSGSDSPKVEELADLPDSETGGKIIGYETSGGDRPDLNDAEVVVSGGRAMQSAENFEKYIYPLADSLGAAIGASRAAVDSGYAPNDWQVGQTGKIVAPNLYFAIGISGAIQHLAGMKDSKGIVAINKDPEAPIYEVADYGLVQDLYEAVPELTEAIKKVKSS